MICVKKLFVFLGLIISGFAYSGAQTIEQTIMFADSLYSRQNYDDALLEYQRALFFSNGDNLYYLYSRSADCYRERGMFIRAAELYELAYFVAVDDSLQLEMIFAESSCYLRSGNYSHALVQLMSIDDCLDVSVLRRKNFYLGVAYFGLEAFSRSEDCFLRAVDTSNFEASAQIKAVFSNRKLMNRPSPNLANILSIMIPGAGQLYAGDARSAINSFLLTGVFFALGVNITVNYGFVDAMFAVFPWFLRYYQGGYRNAEKIAQHVRNENRIVAYQKILTIVEESNKK